MKTAAATLAIASAVTLASAQGSAPIIQSPASLVVCQPALLSFSGGQAPYYISVLPGGQASAAALEQFPAIDGNSFTWNVNLPAGQSVTLAIRDSTGAINYSSELPIQAGTDTSCIGQSITNTGSSTPGGAATSGATNSLSSASTIEVSTSGQSTVTPRTATATSGTSTSVSAPSTGRSSSGTGAPTASGASQAPAPTGAASSQYMASFAGLFGAAAVAAYLA